MENKFLQDFLKTGLFDIGDSDERLKWLQESIADLKKKFEEDNSLLHKFTLVALDPNISDNEPVMIETERIITNHWRALRGKYTEMPRNIIRGVILNALYSVGTANPYAARIIYLTALNFYPFSKLNSEKKLVYEMLNALGEIAEQDAVEEWSLIEEEPSIKLSTLKISDLKFGEAQIPLDELKAKLKTAAKRDPQGHDPYNHPEQWSTHFSNNAGDAIGRVMSDAFATFSKSLSSTTLETPINKFFSEFKKALDANLKASFSSLTAVERRSKLLWWKETLYSPSQKRSYRGLDKYLLPVLMGVDLNNQIPEITPVSVDYLLRDTLFLLINKQDTPVNFSDYLTQIQTEKLKLILKPYFTTLNEIEGRISVTDFISLLLNGRVSINDFKLRTGIDETESITLTDLSVVVLHDLLIQRLIAE
ncbi:MAG: GTPase-associated system all-helical protein GASH [Bacteroidia bacterium]|nr:GTPase-associated system all-helical protein GASH [Bacteroidia bacterium]